MTENLVMDRRGLIQRVLFLAGASAAAGACQTIDALAPLTAGGDDGFSPSQMAVLTAAAARIIPQTDTPGAAQVGVPERLNGLMLTWASAETRQGIERVLAEIHALPGDGRGFAEVSDQEQHELLSAFDAEAMAPSGQTVRVFYSVTELPVNPDYGRLKDLVVALYYMSQEALKQELVYTHVPGRWQPSIPVTPETRPHAAPSPV